MQPGEAGAVVMAAVEAMAAVDTVEGLISAAEVIPVVALAAAGRGLPEAEATSAAERPSLTPVAAGLFRMRLAAAISAPIGRRRAALAKERWRGAPVKEMYRATLRFGRMPFTTPLPGLLSPAPCTTIAL
jgi:hypothetical protein